MKKNKEITIPGEEALEVLAEIEFILISLHVMGSYYMDKSVSDYQRATTDFIDGERVTRRLAKVRRILSEHFDGALGDDDMDDIERHVSNLKFWAPNDPG